jgi:plastocyanin
LKAPRPAWIAIDFVAAALIGGAIFLAARPAQVPAVPTPSESPLESVTIGGDPANFRGELNLYEAREFEAEIEAGRFFYRPTIVTSPPRFEFIVELGNQSRTRHTFTAPKLGIDREVGPLEQFPFLLATPGPGTYVFFCKFHADQGMRGAIKVGTERY